MTTEPNAMSHGIDPMTIASIHASSLARYITIASVHSRMGEKSSWAHEVMMTELTNLVDALGFDLVKREEKQEAA